MRSETAATGHRLWRDGLAGVEVRFVGRGPGDRAAAAAAAGTPSEVAWCHQVHSARLLPARPGPCGEGDALTTTRRELALSVVTADCVPILIAGVERVASVHAGWRGIAAGIIDVALARFASGDELTAWLGPAIGPCCYEVGDDVAARVTAASDPAVALRSRGPRPHLDLHAAVECQLRRSGVQTLRRVPDCTRCSTTSLWSYRREGPGAGRNLAFIWRTSAP